MLRLRFVADKKVDAGLPDPRIAALVERARDHAFLDFAGWTPPRSETDVPTPPPNWVAPFGRPGQAYLELVRLAPFLDLPGLLDQVYWLDIEATRFEDGDYYVYFYNLDTQELADPVYVPVVNGDDMGLAVRLKKSPLLFSLNGNFTGLPGATGKVNVQGTANAMFGIPAYRP